jgi:uncharacterized protein YbjT (DUF2867 family)
LDDPATLESAPDGIDAVFSVQYANPHDENSEMRNAVNLANALAKSEVGQVVHTSSVGSDKFPRYNKHESLIRYWDQKYKIEELFRKDTAKHWTIFHPVYFMENFAEKFADFMNPELKNGIIFSAIKPETRVDLICGNDTAAFARAAFEEPERYSGKDIQLAGDSLSMGEIAAILSEVKGKKIVSQYVSREEAIGRGLNSGSVNSHDYLNDVGFQTNIDELKKYGVPLTSFKEWAIQHKDEIIVL